MQYSLYPLESFFYDLRIKTDIGTQFEDIVTIVTLDEESEEFLGERSPYSFSTHARFIERIITDNPHSINYLLNLQDPETSQEKEEVKKFKSFVNSFKDHGGGFRFGTSMDSWGEQLPPEDLRQLGYSLALLHVDSNSFAKDEVSRRAILNISGDDSLHLWIANKYRVFRGLPPIKAKDHMGSYYLPEADAIFSMFRFYTSPKGKGSKIKKISFHKVLSGDFPKGFFKNKIVLIGSQYSVKLSDYINTPFNKEQRNLVPRLNVHAEIIAALTNGKTVYQIPRYVTNVLCFIMAFFLAFVISRVRPTRGLLLIIYTFFGLLTISFFMFYVFGLWFYITHLLLTIFIVYYIWVPFRAIAEYQTRFAIEEEAKILKKVEHLKQNFISLMSHDLKTPVAKIAAVAEILFKHYQNNNEQKKYLENIIQSTKELNSFITSILDLAKVESLKLNLNKVPKDINQIIESISTTLMFQAQENNIKINLELSPLFPIKIDVELMKRVISNLIENAIKYSGNGSQITVKTWDDNHWVYLEISDNGAGIDSENLDHIFDKFYRITNDLSHTVKGFGLGLYLVKYFVELHEGKINVESKLGEGSKFLVSLKNN